MQQWNISDVRTGFQRIEKMYSKIKISLNKVIVETTDTHVLDVIGESQVKDKVKRGVFWRVSVKDDNTFSLEQVDVFYGGEVEEREVFIKEDYFGNKEMGNIDYAEVVRELQEKSYDYNNKLPFKISNFYNEHSYVMLEKRHDDVPIVKWVIFEYVYFADTQKSQKVNLCEIPVDFERKPDYLFDVYEFLRAPVRYGSFVHFTKVHIDADVFCVSYNGERNVYHLNEIYENYDLLIEALFELEKELVVQDKKNKWQRLAGMDIGKMNELASYLAMEVYFAQGYKGLHGEAVSPLEEDYSEILIEFMERQESYEDYITLLTSKLVGLDSDIIQKAFQYMKENPDEKPLNIVHKFVKPHISSRYEVGKVYFAEVIEESLGKIGAEKVALVKLYDEESHYKFMGRILFGDHVFKHSEYHCYSNRILAEYFDYGGWIGKAKEKAYLSDNTYTSSLGEVIRVRKYQTLPVRITGYGKDKRPIVEYAAGWH